jgi:hypothetical protein
MATLYIAEFETLGVGGNLAPMPPVTEQTRSLSGSSAQSSAFNAKTRYVRLTTDAICSIAFGANPTATTSNMRFPANHAEYFAVQPGDKLAAITNS